MAKKKATHGGCKYASLSPATMNENVKVLNFSLAFEEALKLHLSLGQALAELNSYNRSTGAGKRKCAKLAFYLEEKKRRIRVIVGNLPPSVAKRADSNLDDDSDD
jgi:hypothetical protein